MTWKTKRMTRRKRKTKSRKMEISDLIKTDPPKPENQMMKARKKHQLKSLHEEQPLFKKVNTKKIPMNLKNPKFQKKKNLRNLHQPLEEEEGAGVVVPLVWHRLQGNNRVRKYPKMKDQIAILLQNLRKKNLHRNLR